MAFEKSRKKNNENTFEPDVWSVQIAGMIFKHATGKEQDFMAVFRAFKALRPTEGKAAAVAALPYDVVNREEAAAIGKENPDSFLHVDRAEMDLPAETDLYDAKVYQKAKRTCIRWRRLAFWFRTISHATTYMNWYARGRFRLELQAALLLMII